MAFSWGDGWDLYAAFADAYAGYWDSGAGTPTFVAGRFAGSQALHITATSTTLTKSSGQNDAVHHIVAAFRQTATIAGSTLGTYFQLLDGVTGQCCVVFRSDGAILLTSGTPGGTVLDTYTGAFPVTNTWYAFEIEIVINNTTGRFRVRKNGNTSDDYDSTAIRNTRVSANNYANKLTIGMQAAVNSQEIDDTLWQSSAATGGWLSDIRCYTRLPASDASVQFSRTPTNAVITPFTSTTTNAISAGTARYTPFTSVYDGTVGTATISLGTGYTGNLKCSLFASSGSAPTSVLGSATPLNNPVSGVNTFTFGTPVLLARNTQYWIGWDSDTSSGTWNVSGGIAGISSTTPYASFPAASPTTANSAPAICTITVTIAGNFATTNEPQQDATTSYVYDSTAGHADLYGIGAIASTPVSTIAVTTRGYMQKSDAGSRTATVQLKSGGTTVAAPTLTLTTSGWTWAWRTDVNDPNTSAAWTAAAVNNAQVGPVVVT